MTTFAVETHAALPLARASAISWNALDRPLAHDAELSVHALEDSGVLLGAFQRLVDASEFHSDVPRFRRISGGTHLYVAPGSLHLVLAMARSSLLPDANKIVNRYVRPLLRAFGAAYFGRDCLVRAKSPIGFAGFAHDAASGRAVFEAVIPSSADWSESSRGSYRGAPLDAVDAPAGKIDATVDLYISQIGEAARLVLPPQLAAPAADATPWAARIEEAIGPILAGRNGSGALEVGGELMASRDVLAALAQNVTLFLRSGELSGPDVVGAEVDRAFSQPNAVLFGVRSLLTLRDVLVSAANE